MKTLLIILFVGLIPALCGANESNDNAPLTDPNRLVEKVLLPKLRSSLVKKSQQKFQKGQPTRHKTSQITQTTPEKDSKSSKPTSIRSGLLSAAE